MLVKQYVVFFFGCVIFTLSSRRTAKKRRAGRRPARIKNYILLKRLPLKGVVIRLAIRLKSLDEDAVPRIELACEVFKFLHLVDVDVVELDDDKSFRDACLFEATAQDFSKRGCHCVCLTCACRWR